eukprot:9202423-Pyramimonas_sp.AAC.1
MRSIALPCAAEAVNPGGADAGETWPLSWFRAAMPPLAHLRQEAPRWARWRPRRLRQASARAPTARAGRGNTSR